MESGDNRSDLLQLAVDWHAASRFLEKFVNESGVQLSAADCRVSQHFAKKRKIGFDADDGVLR
jgi:hypothetical protein